MVVGKEGGVFGEEGCQLEGNKGVVGGEGGMGGVWSGGIVWLEGRDCVVGGEGVSGCIGRRVFGGRDGAVYG